METNMNEERTQLSEIQSYFEGSCIFITGATGFLGKLILEKLLRTCASTSKVYILIREKKGNSVEKRFQELLDNALFDCIKKEQPRFAENMVPFAGDCALPDLGLSDDARRILVKEVDCIFHCAATVRFDEKLRIAVHINIRGTRDLLCLARKMERLKSFIHVSTAYSNCPNKEIDEKFYAPPITGEQLLTLVDNINDELLENITPVLIGSWPNTYAFTKAVAEDLVRLHGKGLQIAVVRPSIVVATAIEPVPGWCDNLYGPTGIAVGAASGLIKTVHMNQNCKTDMIPADFVVNCTMAAAWEVGTSSPHIKLRKGEYKTPLEETLLSGSHFKEPNVEESERDGSNIPIYNCVSSPQKPITWRKFLQIGEGNSIYIPASSMIWTYCLIPNSYYFMHVVCVFLLHDVPAYGMDFLLKCVGKKPMFVRIYQKVHKSLDATAYFTTNEWKFQNNNTQALWRRLNAEDKKRFKFDLNDFDWESYLLTFARGTRLYILKEPLETLSLGRSKQIKLKVAHYAIQIIFLLMLYKLASALLNLIL